MKRYIEEKLQHLTTDRFRDGEVLESFYRQMAGMSDKQVSKVEELRTFVSRSRITFRVPKFVDTSRKRRSVLMNLMDNETFVADFCEVETLKIHPVDRGTLQIEVANFLSGNGDWPFAIGQAKKAYDVIWEILARHNPVGDAVKGNLTQWEGGCFGFSDAYVDNELLDLAADVFDDCVAIIKAGGGRFDVGQYVDAPGIGAYGCQIIQMGRRTATVSIYHPDEGEYHRQVRYEDLA